MCEKVTQFSLVKVKAAFRWFNAEEGLFSAKE